VRGTTSRTPRIESIPGWRSFRPNRPKVGLAVPQIDLAATKSVAPTDLLVGQEADYTVTLDHQGAVSPSGVYTLPASTATDVTARDDFGAVRSN
jgi:hypothetical protein